MNDWCDVPGEMPGDTFLDADALDDQVAEAILSGHGPAEAGFEPLTAFSNDVRTVADRANPQPNAALASVLSTGFSTEKGDLLVTAGSNVIGPATTQAAGLPKWRNRTNMLPVGIFSGVVAKVVAGVVTGLVGVTGLGAAGALPGPAQDAVASVVNTVTPLNLPTSDGDGGAAVSTSLPVPGVDVGVTVDTRAAGNKTTTSVSSGAGGAAASAGATTKSTGGTTGASGNASVNLPTPTIPNIPGVPNLGSLPVQIPTCVTDIVDVRTGQPKVPLSQISTKVVSCVRSLISTAGVPIPAGISQCVDSILSMVTGVTPGSVPNITGLDVNKCVPVDVTKCMSSVMGMFQNLPGFNLGFGGSTGTTGGSASATGGFNIPFFGNMDLSGCMPFNLDGCLSSLLGMAGNLPNVNTGGIPGLGAGTIPSLGSLNLSSCVPFGSLPSIPGLGFLSSFLPR